MKDIKSQCSNHETSPLFSILFLLLLTFFLYLKCISHSQHMIASWFLNPLLIIVAFLVFIFRGVCMCAGDHIPHAHT